MQKHFTLAMGKIEGLINLWSAPSAMSQALSDGLCVPGFGKTKVLLAVSGGVDSMCMADVFLRQYGPDSFAIAHCNFHLRGEESDGDESMVRAWADGHGVVCHVTDFDTEDYAGENGISIEMAARDLRYGWFARLCRENGYMAVAVAHNANDNAETLILNLLRGTGLRGLGGMSVVSDLLNAAPLKLIRPLLDCSRKMIEGYAFAHKVPYREDSTNASSDYKRNRIRNEVFPIFEKINPSFIRTLNREMVYFSEASRIVEDYCSSVIPGDQPVIPGDQPVIPGDQPVIPGLTGNLSIPTASLLSHPHWRYLLYYMLEPYGFNHAVLASIESLLLSDRTISGKRFESDTHVLLTGRGELTVLPREDVPSFAFRQTGLSSLRHGEDFMPVPGPGTYHVAGRRFKVEELEWTPDMPLKQPEGVLQFDADVLRFPFAVRRWRHGDWLVPFGMSGRKKVSDLFADLRFTGLQKDGAVMIVDCSREMAECQHVAGVLGVRMDDRYKIKETTSSIIRITVLS